MKPSFILHKDSLCVLEDLTNEQRGELFYAIYCYQIDKEIQLSDIVKIAFSQFKNQFIRDEEKYIKTVEKRKEAGSKGGKQRVANQANASKTKQTKANQAVSKNKKDNVSDSDSVKGSEEKSNSVAVIPEKSLAHKTIDYLNQQVNKNFKYVESNLKHINGRIKEGATEKELSYVIDVKVKEWLNDPKMKGYLRPSTLFTPSNFDKYLNQDVVISDSDKVGYMLENNIFDMIDEMDAQKADNNTRMINAN